tara:strand:- start:9 stop:602 length:594 start_codon:yes stop_codon:yes gene_type:complete
MPNYQNGLIYKLCCKDANITDIYVGSTTNFKQRKKHHKSDCNTEKSNSSNRPVYKFIRENGRFENWDMVLVEYYKCETKLELEKREREIIENLKPTLNKTIPTRTSKEWREDNKEKVEQYKKEYNKKNKEKAKEYYQNNKEQIKENYEKNKEKILEQLKEKVTCECGAILTIHHLARHKKSIKHNGYIILKNNIDNI